MRDTRKQSPPVWLLVSVAWLGPALLAALQRYMQGRLGNWEPASWRQLLWESADWLLYALLTPAVFWFARRFPLIRSRLGARIPLHLVASLVLCIAWATGGELLRWGILPKEAAPTLSSLVSWFFISLPFGVAVYFAVLGVEHATRYFLEARQQEMQSVQLSAQLAEARLGALRMQMQPHFLLNTLNAITVIVRDRDTATATRMLETLGEMLRRVMRTDRPTEIPLREELDFVRQYLAIEQVRFSDRLQPVFLVPDACLAALVPEFMLQPLVENALLHGLAQRIEATLVRIEVARVGHELHVSVTDDGPGGGMDGRAGVGLSNIRERLATLYGSTAALTLTPRVGGGTVALIRLPYREPPPEAEDG